MIGPNYTLRLTITGFNAFTGLSFVNAPSLGGGIRDIEFGFLGGLPAQQVRTISGDIKVFKTNTTILPSFKIQSETSAHHQIGRIDGDGWSVNVREKASSYLQYGPCINIDPLGGASKDRLILLQGPARLSLGC